ncbi:MAG: hypothetical protein AAF685_02290 [Cyanobacteria bacterium P01_C01_bin.89]
MNAQLMMQPSSLVESGIQLEPVRNLQLFKFNEPLQLRLEELNAKQRETTLSDDEQIELLGILELDRILTLLNAKAIAAGRQP